ncbi:MAG TPA: polysaccharide deacetylase family protein [Solirubrobacteraceae bacterium]|nr:polysaccharide deacetylase family protein [Solirubrobacteraceae bacterium]
MPALAVTIDTEFPDHPAKDPLGTLDRLLDLLERRNLRVTFFILGAWARAYPDRVSAIREAGHHIGNHSFSHCALTRMTETGIIEDLVACHDVLTGLGIESRPWFRAPYGELTHPQLDVELAIGRAGYRHVHWHADGKDWAPGASADSVAAALVADVRACWPRPAIVLLHSWPDAAPAALERVMDALEPDNVSYLTVEEVDSHVPSAGAIGDLTN